MEPKEILFTQPAAYGRKAVANIPRSADLLARLYLVIDLGALLTAPVGPGSGAHFTEDVGRAIIEKVTLESGNVVYDTLWPELMHAWEELSVPSDRHLGRVTGKAVDESTLETFAQNDQLLYVPLPFFMQNDLTQCMPMIAMHLTDLQVTVTLKPKADVIASTYAGTVLSTDAVLNAMSLVGEFIYLDDPERELFASSAMSYIVTQNQRTTHSVATTDKKASIPIHFNHPTKEFIIMGRTDANTTDKKWFNFEGQEEGKFDGELFDTMAITLNNNNRVSPRDPLYFRVIQPSEHHTRVPAKHIYVYSFAIKPEQPQSTGTLNLSRIENTRIELTFKNETKASALEVLVFARSVNVIRFARGVASLKWSS
jgi:hypothetical protein